MGFFLAIFFMVFFGFFAYKIVTLKDEQDKVKAMSSGERALYTSGPLNVHLICPHCQTKGLVRAKKVTRTVTSTGKVGGILKTDTTTQTKTNLTQHHCDQCGTTWDV